MAKGFDLRSVLLTVYDAFWGDAESLDFSKFRNDQLVQQLHIFSAVYGTMSCYCCFFAASLWLSGLCDFFSFGFIIGGIVVHGCVPLALLVPEDAVLRFRKTEMRLDLDGSVFGILLTGIGLFGIASVRMVFITKPLHLSMVLTVASWRAQGLLMSLDLKSHHWSVLQAVVFVGFTSVLFLSAMMNKSSKEQGVALILFTANCWLGTSCISRFYRLLRWRSVYGGFEAAEKQLKAEQRNNKFLGYIMHEVRNPLQGALLVLNALRLGLLSHHTASALSKKTSVTSRKSLPRSPILSPHSSKSWVPHRKRGSPVLQMRRLQAARSGSVCGPSPASSSPAPLQLNQTAPRMRKKHVGSCEIGEGSPESSFGIRRVNQQIPPPSPPSMRQVASCDVEGLSRGCSSCAQAELALEACKGKAAVLEVQLLHIVSVCSDVLQLEKLEHGRFQIEYTHEDPLVWFENLLAVQRETFRSNQITLHENVTVEPELLDLFDLVGEGEGEDAGGGCVGQAAWLRLGQAAQNFFSNAVKFCPKHGEGEVTADLKIQSCTVPPRIFPLPGQTTTFGTNEREKQMAGDVRWVRLRLSVKDNGVGIEEQEGKNLFLPYSQIRAGEFQEGGGTGLGLCISKEFVDRHADGKIGFHSKGRGLGADFFFEVTIPLRQVVVVVGEHSQEEPEEWEEKEDDLEEVTAEPQCENVIIRPHREAKQQQRVMIGEVSLPPLPATAFDPRLSSLPVLIVDDSVFARMGIASLLQRLRIPFVEVDDGSEAVRRVKGGDRFRLVLMDRNMKNLDGELATAQMLSVIREERAKVIKEKETMCQQLDLQRGYSNDPSVRAKERESTPASCTSAATTAATRDREMERSSTSSVSVSTLRSEKTFFLDKESEKGEETESEETFEEWMRGVEPLIVGLTGDVGAEAVTAFRDAGAFTCLQKPLTAQDLRTLLEYSNALPEGS
uniref:histidine kinase n=1 Tax=Chromera velia CCMP2878 TaxID=1169474 RepID=A0A0G4G2X0_9ALVE|eukprot:Cvel_19938.t1-p1 / transcript=Cvel_19938.t1 / gene=Cvel_19938 / organism=Chromera_velia_CCMP2878 / gene_product=hypothetical protein / transcript_product=hypothetical protein / location=Cvel_scaffold1754:27901-32788(+) / protein_length=950 / sequence_SO=supercontig / SO=protein_coding / is_pseudo=false